MDGFDPTVFDVVGAMVFVLDRGGRVLFMNRVGREISGRSVEEVRGTTFRDLVSLDDVEMIREPQGREGASPRRYEAAWTMKDGRRHWIAWSSTILAGEGDAHVLVTGIDVTDRKLSEERYKGIVAMAPDGIISLDDQHRIAVFNEAAEEIFGYSRDEVLGQPLDILLPERFRAAHRRQVQAFAEGPAQTKLMRERRPIAGLRKNGEEFPAEAAIEKSHADGAKILTVLLRDVTETRRAEAEQRFLAEAGDVLASTLDYTQTLASVAQLAVRSLADVCIVDIVGDDGEIQRVAVAAADPAKAPAAEALRSYPNMRRPPFTRLVLDSGEAVVRADLPPDCLGTIAENEEHLARLRELAPTSFMAVPLRARGRMLGVLVFVATESRRRYGTGDLRFAMEMARRAALAVDNARSYKAAREALKARDQVLGVVAHDLRSPLTAIGIAAEALRRQSDRGFEGRALDTIVRSSERMQRMIEDLLDAARIDTGQLAISAGPCAGDALVAEAIDALRPTREPREIRAEISSDVPAVLADRDRVMQVFSNLIGNALKFTPPDREITVGVEARGAEVCFWVRDRGPGIDPRDVPHLFDRFWQGVKGDRRGVGLGLFICRAIVEAHRGRIWTESTPGEGSTFYFTLPIAKARAESSWHVPTPASL